jgi:transposase-like protein
VPACGGVISGSEFRQALWDKYSGQVLHGSARTTAAVRAAIQRSAESLQTLATRYGIDPKTVAKWRKRSTTTDAVMGPKPVSTVLTQEEEAIAVAFRKHTLLPLDDCLYALQATIPHLSRLHAAGAASRRCTAVFSATASVACP